MLIIITRIWLFNGLAKTVNSAKQTIDFHSLLVGDSVANIATKYKLFTTPHQGISI